MLLRSRAENAKRKHRLEFVLLGLAESHDEEKKNNFICNGEFKQAWDVFIQRVFQT
jgi:hypothetical protein